MSESTNLTPMESLANAYLEAAGELKLGHWPPKDHILKQIRDAGQYFHRIGGHEAMANAASQLYFLTGSIYSTGAHLNELWDGIGNWKK